MSSAFIIDQKDLAGVMSSMGLKQVAAERVLCVPQNELSLIINLKKRPSKRVLNQFLTVLGLFIVPTKRINPKPVRRKYHV